MNNPTINHIMDKWIQELKTTKTKQTTEGYYIIPKSKHREEQLCSNGIRLRIIKKLHPELENISLNNIEYLHTVDEKYQIYKYFHNPIHQELYPQINAFIKINTRAFPNPETILTYPTALTDVVNTLNDTYQLTFPQIAHLLEIIKKHE
jgi:hypothetical protein